LRPLDTDLRIEVLLASVLTEILDLYPAGKLCRLSVNLIPELIRCHSNDSVLEQSVIFRQYRPMVEILILASYFPGLLEKWRTRQYSEFLGNVHTWKISKFRIFVRNRETSKVSNRSAKCHGSTEFELLEVSPTGSTTPYRFRASRDPTENLGF
jgi:hypothetical protein